MSYFKKIVERTLKVKVDSGSLKPAITPDSIPEPFEIKAWAGIRSRRITASNTSGSAKKKPADAARSAPAAKAAGEEEERLPEQVVHTAAAAAAAAAPVSPAKQVAQAAPQDKAFTPDSGMTPGNEQVEVSPTEKEKEPDRDFAATTATATPVVLHVATEVGRADAAASQTKPLERRGLVSKDTAEPENHPQLRPATGADDKYPLAVTQQDETTITINIGRIEVRAVSPVVEAPSLPRKEYSPPLSLDEYLKQRMEGKKK